MTAPKYFSTGLGMASLAFLTLLGATHVAAQKVQMGSDTINFARRIIESVPFSA